MKLDFRTEERRTPHPHYTSFLLLLLLFLLLPALPVGGCDGLHAGEVAANGELRGEAGPGRSVSDSVRQRISLPLFGTHSADRSR